MTRVIHLGLPLGLAACAAAATPVVTMANHQETAVPIVPADQTTTFGPPVSRVRSPVLDRALAANSNAALIMFLLKYPDDAFAKDARTNLKARHIPDSAAALHAAAGADAALVAAFDAARLAGTDAAWSAFLARYGDSPLAAEVARLR